MIFAVVQKGMMENSSNVTIGRTFSSKDIVYQFKTNVRNVPLGILIYRIINGINKP